MAPRREDHITTLASDLGPMVQGKYSILSEEQIIVEANGGAMQAVAEESGSPSKLLGDCIGPLNIQMIKGLAFDMLQSFFNYACYAEEHKYQELHAAIWIQAAWRRKATRLKLKRWNAHATTIQRWYRGHLHREFAAVVRQRVDKFLRLIYFGQHAVVIQRHFRGFYSRKYKHSFYRRKSWIAKVVKAGNLLRENIVETILAQNKKEQDEVVKKMEEDLANFIPPKVGHDEYGIPIKVANNKFYAKHSKALHSKMSLDTRRRVEDAALITTMLGTYITTQGCGPYVTKWEVLKKVALEGELLNPHVKNFDTSPYIRIDNQHSGHLTIHQDSEFGQRERLRKEEQKRLEREFPNMVENPFILHHPSGKCFDLPTVIYDKVFPKRHHHTHLPHGYHDRDRHLNSMLI